MKTLTIKAISVEELTDLNTFVVALYDNLELPSEWIELQRSLSTDEQDKLLGMDTYCIALSNGATFYGGIESYILQNNVLKIILSVSAAQELCVEKEIELHLKVSQDVISTLHAGLNRLFEKEPERPQDM